MSRRDVWAVVPLKDTTQSKQRLASAYSSALRQRLAIAMFADVMDTLAAVSGLAGILVVTDDPRGGEIAKSHGAQITTDGARDGHTGAVLAGAAILARYNATMLALPGDIPLVTPAEIATLLAAHGEAPSLTIVPAHDGRGSNAILLSPPDAMPLKFGGESYRPHLATAERLGLNVQPLNLPGIALDIDEPEDIERFLEIPSSTRARTLLLQTRNQDG